MMSGYLKWLGVFALKSVMYASAIVVKLNVDVERISFQFYMEVFLGFVWDLSGICLGFVWDLFGICLGFVWDLVSVQCELTKSKSLP